MLFSWRARRQLAVLAIVALPVALVIVFLAFKIVPEVSCFDNRLNQGETQIDCGGPCGPCELKNPKAVTLFWAKLVEARENSYDLIALIENPNEVLFSSKVNYKFTFFDGLTPFAEKNGTTFLLPQERVHIVEPNISTSRGPSHVELKITNVDWEYSKLERPNFAVESREYLVEEENGAKRSAVKARIFNSSVFDFREIIVQVVVFDGEGNVLGSNRTLIDNFRANTRREVKLPWPTLLKGKVASIVIEPRVNVFDPNSILKPR